MRVITEFNKHLQVGNTNIEYEKIFNCRVIDPTYEAGKWLHNSEFFLDKRYWMEEYIIWDYHYTDDIELYWVKYYLYHNNNQMFVWADNSTQMVDIAWPFNYNSNNPIRFSEWRWANWILKESNLVITNWAEYDNTTIKNEDWVYEDWYIVLDVWTWLNIETWDYVLFKNNIYAWSTIKIDWYDSWKIYIMWLNSKWSIPVNWDRIDIYSDSGKIPLVWTEDWLYAIHINWLEESWSTNLLSWDIEDVVKFNEEIFVLKDEVVYFSSKTFDDNLQFYKSINRKRIRWAYKLISKWKFLIIMWDDNRLVSPIVETTGNSEWYTFYPLNYDGDLYSKYSYVFTDSTLYIWQSDKQLVKVDISSLNATAFNLETTPITESVRWIFDSTDDYNSIDKWELFVNENKINWKLHFIYQKKDWTTIEYEYDKIFKHWLLHTYNSRIYKISDKFLYDWWVAKINWYTDLWEEYKQSINFTIQTPNLITKVWLIRTVMWISNDMPLKYNIDIDVESSMSKTTRQIKVKNLTFDTMPVDHSLDMLNILSNWADNKHDWNIASIQRTIMMSWRYHRYDINWYDRFIYWYSYVLWVASNIFVNERNFSW